MNVKGLSIKDIINMDWDSLNKLNTKDLKQITSRLVSASNKRIRRLEKTQYGTESYAYRSVEKRGRMFSVRGKNINQVKQEFKLASNFLNFKTSTVKGWEKTKSKIEKQLSDTTGGESQTWSENTKSKFWKVYRKTEEMHGGTFGKGESSQLQQQLSLIFNTEDKRHGVDYFADILDRKYEEMYEQETAEEEQEQDISSFFK